MRRSVGTLLSCQSNLGLLNQLALCPITPIGRESGLRIRKVWVQIPCRVPGHIHVLLKSCYFSRCWAPLKTARLFFMGEPSDGHSAGCKPVANGIVGSSPTSLTKVYCLVVSSDLLMHEKLSRNCHLYAPVAQRKERGATNPGLVGVQIFSGVPYTDLAQLEEHGPYKAEVMGSSPLVRTNKTHTATEKILGIFLTGLGVMRLWWNW